MVCIAEICSSLLWEAAVVLSLDLRSQLLWSSSLVLSFLETISRSVTKSQHFALTTGNRKNKTEHVSYLFEAPKTEHWRSEFLPGVVLLLKVTNETSKAKLEAFRDDDQQVVRTPSPPRTRTRGLSAKSAPHQGAAGSPSR